MSQAETELRVTVSEQTDWTIKNFKHAIAEDVLKSQTFHFAETRLYLQVRYENWHNMIALVLKSDTAISQEIDCALGLKKCDGSVFKFFTDKLRHPLGLAEFEIFEDVAAMSADGSVTFFCILSTAGGPKKNAKCQTSSSVGNAIDATAEGTASSGCVETLAQNFKQLYISGLHSDVIMKVEDREFQAHRCVLSSRSQFFASMFEHEMAEKLSGVVDVADCDAGCFEAFLLFLYTGDVVHVTSVNAAGVYTIAEKYEIIDLKTACIQFLKGNLHVWTFCDAVHLAVAHDETELLEAATEFFIRNSLAILSTPQWKEFIVKNPLMANDLFLKKEQRQHGI